MRNNRSIARLSYKVKVRDQKLRQSYDRALPHLRSNPERRDISRFQDFVGFSTMGEQHSGNIYATILAICVCEAET